MSYWIYLNKNLLETKDGQLLLLCQVADSSVTDWTGRRHPKHWTIVTFSDYTQGLLHEKSDYKRAVHAMYENEVARLEEYRQKYHPEAPETTSDSYTYYGNSYNGCKKLKSMRSFYSARRTIPAEQFFEENVLEITFYYMSKEWKELEMYVKIARTEEALLEMHKFMLELKENIDKCEGAESVAFRTEVTWK